MRLFVSKCFCGAYKLNKNRLGSTTFYPALLWCCLDYVCRKLAEALQRAAPEKSVEDIERGLPVLFALFFFALASTTSER